MPMPTKKLLTWLGYEEGVEWFVTIHDRGDETIRGPYRTAREAGVVRAEMERDKHWDKFNLAVMGRPVGGATDAD